MTESTKPKVLAISSGGGHWEQLMLVREAFQKWDVVYANTLTGLSEREGIAPCFTIRDCSRSSMFSVFQTTFEMIALFKRTRPSLVVSTGAAPGLIGIVVGRIYGAKTIWIDSIANSERLSMSGRLATKFAHLVVTQWKHLSQDNKTVYLGSVL